jgi:hypothetical protein
LKFHPEKEVGRDEIIFEGSQISTFTTLMAFWNVTRENKKKND